MSETNNSSNMTALGYLADALRVTTVKTRVIARHQQIVRIDHGRRGKAKR